MLILHKNGPVQPGRFVCVHKDCHWDFIHLRITNAHPLKTAALVLNIVMNVVWFLLVLASLFIRLVFRVFSKKDHEWDGWKEMFSIGFNSFPLVVLAAILAGWILYARKYYQWSIFAVFFPLINVIICIATLFSIVWE